jgi:hypothetical protein
MNVTKKIRYIDQAYSEGIDAASHDYLYSESVNPDPDSHWRGCELSKYCTDSKADCRTVFMVSYRGMWNALRGMDKACCECGVPPRRPNWSETQRIVAIDK